MKKRIGLAVLLLVLLVVGWVVQLYWMTGQFKTIAPHFAGTCKVLGGVVGPEDITIHPRTGVAFLSGCDRRAVLAGRAGGGAIYAYDLNTVTAEPVNLTPSASEDFRPHGISIFVGEDGRDVLFVVNHQGGGHRIDAFDLADGGLTHRETFTSPLLVSPNDIVGVGPDRFYVTNDHGCASGWKRILEDYLRRPWSNVVYYDGSEFVEAAAGIAYANGINVSPDGRRLYVCSTLGRSLHVFDREPVSGQLEHREEVDLDTAVDNIEVDADGDLWLGAHPQLLTFVQHMEHAGTVSPSQVVRVVPKQEGGYAVEEVFLDTGEQISGSSVGAAMGNRLLIGAILDSKFLDCRFLP